jgi:hypothetical protein
MHSIMTCCDISHEANWRATLVLNEQGMAVGRPAAAIRSRHRGAGPSR